MTKRTVLSLLFVFTFVFGFIHLSPSTAATPTRDVVSSVSDHGALRAAKEHRYCSQYPSWCRLERRLESALGRPLTQAEVRRLVAYVRVSLRADRPLPTSVDGYSCVPSTDSVPAGAIQVKNTCWMGGFLNCVMNHENSARVVNRYFGNGINLGPPSSRHTASGLFQIIDDTWGGYGGVQYAAQADAKTQFDRAVWLIKHGGGPGHWAGTGCPGT